MAGDWIKMRGALLDNPKVIAMSRVLHKSKEFREFLTPGGAGSMNGQIVSDTALRCVTTALLLKVWSVAREHGVFVGDDLVLRHNNVNDIDQMCGVSGVGEAMESVGWATFADGLVLPNFIEFNVPMTNAEKQKEYRERKKQVTIPLRNEGNENSQNVTSREEKRRVIPPNPLFDQFWRAYPRKEAKQAALKAFEKLKLVNGDFERVMAALEAAKKAPQWTRDGGKFIPHPATWLNGRRFEDETQRPMREEFHL